MFTYRLHLEDGSDAGEATYSVMVKLGEEILYGNGRRFRVLDVVAFEGEDSRIRPGCYRSRRQLRPAYTVSRRIGTRPALESHLLRRSGGRVA
jgi:hypothetical protein